jgi:hypothetical protein
MRPETGFLQQLLKTTQTNSTRHVATRNSFPASGSEYYAMADQKKQERDFTPEVDAILPEVEALVKVC